MSSQLGLCKVAVVKEKTSWEEPDSAGGAHHPLTLQCAYAKYYLPSYYYLVNSHVKFSVVLNLIKVNAI